MAIVWGWTTSKTRPQTVGRYPEACLAGQSVDGANPGLGAGNEDGEGGV